MDTNKKEKGGKNRFFTRLGAAVCESIIGDGTAPLANFGLFVSLGTVALGFLFSATHAVFGAYPFGLAFVCSLQRGVWLALVGGILGSLSLGRGGPIYALVILLAVFLRVIISGTENKADEPKLFTENVSLRVCSAVISGAILSLYEILSAEALTSSLLRAAAMVFISGGVTLLLSGAFHPCIGIKELAFSTARIFDAGEGEGRRMAYFKLSVLSIVFLTSLSLGRFDVFGIDPSYIFAGLVTLFASVRFGAVYGAVAGFISSVPLSATYSVAFALAGAVSGCVFPLGAVFAIIGANAAVSFWGAYVLGASGFLSVFPEFLISTFLFMPLMKHLERQSRAPDDRESSARKATDMVGTMALSYRNKKVIACEDLEHSFGMLLPLIMNFLGKGETLEDCTAFAKLLAEVKESTLREREMDEELTERLEARFTELGISPGIIRVFGDERKHFILAGEDKDGTLITSPIIKKTIEEVSGNRVSTPEYYRRDDMALMECESAEGYRVSFATATKEGCAGEISGDSVSAFTKDTKHAYGIICDGMGSGTEAQRFSAFAEDFLTATLGSGASYSTLIHMLNAFIRRGGSECSVALDIFTFDLVSGKASFLKSGAAASYIKRASGGLFRLRSETLPIGIIKKIDTEQIGVSVTEGDLIIMMSDGISGGIDDAPWLISFLNRAPDSSLEDYAKAIINESLKYSRSTDDKSVIVAKIEKI